MEKQNDLRIRLCALISDYGTTITYIAQKANIDRSSLSKFRNGKLYLEPSQVQRLDRFLSERGYSNELKAITAVIQGTFDT